MQSFASQKSGGSCGDPRGILGDPGGSCIAAVPAHPIKTEVSSTWGPGIRTPHEFFIILAIENCSEKGVPERRFQNFKGGAGDNRRKPNICGKFAFSILKGVRGTTEGST